MQTVKVRKDELLATLKKNRETHFKAVEVALEAYREAAISELDRMQAEAREGLRIQRSLRLKEPLNMTGQYDQAIRMLEMSVDEHITLSSVDFAHYVMDRWPWQQQFAATNNAYLLSKGHELPYGVGDGDEPF